MKTFGSVSLGIVLTAVIVGGGTYYFENQKAENALGRLQSQISALQDKVDKFSAVPVAPETPSAIGGVRADWKTYSNSSLKYSIGYPSNWILDSQDANGDSKGDNKVLFLLTKQRQGDLDSHKVVRVFDVSVRVYASAAELPNNEVKKLDFESWIRQEAEGYGFINRKPIIIDGVSGYQGIVTGDGESYMAMVRKGNFIYQIETGDTTVPTETEQGVIKSLKLL